ncbi:hypothetical protein MMC27_007975 [Xylographa pallens]|nr:hypothetical protein [Xylographa pallens]
MRVQISFLALLGVSVMAALQSPHKKAAKFAPKKQQVIHASTAPRVVQDSVYLTNKTASFAVNGSALPDINFDIGESYAGTLSINANANNHNRLWFWFFPSENPAASNEITIWLNGGPGCSSLDGLFQENGPFQWQSGTFRPVKNPYSWNLLTNMIYIDQPVSTGFSPGNITVNNEDDVATDFMGFWKNFMETFSLNGRDVYITGESYAGQYVSDNPPSYDFFESRANSVKIPYIASAMLDTNNTEYYNVKGIQINDPSINYDETMLEAPAMMAVNQNNNILNLNATYLAFLNAKADSCGFTNFMEDALVFPPKGKLPTAPQAFGNGCDVFDDFTTAAAYVNPCYNVYHILDFCPYLWDELGFPSYAGGPNNYFNQSDVQKVIHAPPTDFSICGGGPNLFPKGDQSVPSGLGPLPSVIERTNNVLMGHGLKDFLLFANGSLATIQNMTWNGMQGFQTAPGDPFYVPYHPQLSEDANEVDEGDAALVGFNNDAGAGIQGTTHTERGFTFTTVELAGHEIPQYTPGAAYRMLEFLLGRIESLTQVGDFTTQSGNYTGTTAPERRRSIEFES